MKKKIFYSWQSDLKPATNRTFIEKCLKEAAQIVTATNWEIDPVIDRDTVGVAGTPHIASTIFDKIDAAHIFVADISIVGQLPSGRITSNPNVMMETGYAAKALGWSHVLTVFNSDSGKVEDLPFDLRFRRPIQYNGSEKAIEKSGLVKTLVTAIEHILELDSNAGPVQRYWKQKVDDHFLEIYHHLNMLLRGYQSEHSSTWEWTLLNWDGQQVLQALFESDIMGFTFFKDWKYYANQLENLLSQPMALQYFSVTTQTAVVGVIRALKDLAIVSRKPDLLWDRQEDFHWPLRFTKADHYYPGPGVDSYIMQWQDPNDHNAWIEKDRGVVSGIRGSALRRLFRLNSNIEIFAMTVRDLLIAMDAYMAIDGVLIDPLSDFAAP